MRAAKEGSGGDKSALKPWAVKLNQMICSPAEHTTSHYVENKLIVFTVGLRKWFTVDPFCLKSFYHSSGIVRPGYTKT